VRWDTLPVAQSSWAAGTPLRHVLEGLLEAWDSTWAVGRRASAGGDGVCGSGCLGVVKEARLCPCLPQEVCVQLS